MEFKTDEAILERHEQQATGLPETISVENIGEISLAVKEKIKTSELNINEVSTFMSALKYLSTINEEFNKEEK